MMNWQADQRNLGQPSWWTVTGMSVVTTFSTIFHLIVIILRYLGGIWVTFYSTGPWTSGWKWIGEPTRFRISHCVFRYWPELTMGDHLQVRDSRFLNVFGCSDVFRVSGQLYGCHQEHTPFDVVAWHGKWVLLMPIRWPRLKPFLAMFLTNMIQRSSYMSGVSLVIT